jgi:hypothetical protein
MMTMDGETKTSANDPADASASSTTIKSNFDTIVRLAARFDDPTVHHQLTGDTPTTYAFRVACPLTEATSVQLPTGMLLKFKFMQDNWVACRDAVAAQPSLHVRQLLVGLYLSVDEQHQRSLTRMLTSKRTIQFDNTLGGLTVSFA